jgi:hypothetical protein
MRACQTPSFPPRLPAPQAALTSKLRQGAAKQHGDGLIQAINLCNLFIGSTQADSTAALEVLKHEVKRALLAQQPAAGGGSGRVSVSSAAAAAQPGALGPSPRPPPTASSQVGPATGCPGTLLCPVLGAAALLPITTTTRPAG